MIPHLLFRLASPTPRGFIAQVPLEALLNTPGMVRAFQEPVEVLRGVRGQFFSAQLVVEVLRSMHCVIAPPPVPPVPQCPPELELPITAGTPGCVAADLPAAAGGGGCVVPVPSTFGTE